MTEIYEKTISSICKDFSAQKLPMWNELPDLDIYMDQVLALLSRYLKDYPGYEEKSMTSSMINNYVKQEIIPAPIKKRYNRAHLAFLMMVYILKAGMPINDIGRLLKYEVSLGKTEEEIYTDFCENYQKSMNDVAMAVKKTQDEGCSVSSPIFFAALRAQAEQAMSQKLSTLLPNDKTENGKKKKNK